MRFFKPLFKKKPSIEEVKQQSDTLLTIPIKEIEYHQKELDQLIDTITAVLRNIQKRKKESPNNSILANLWMNGFALKGHSHALFNYLEDSKLDIYKEITADLWAECTLTVCAHYHHMVGPAMLAAAKMKMKVGKTEWALKGYRAIIDDFKSIAFSNEDEQEHFYEEEMRALISLKTAIEQLMEYNDMAESDDQKLLELVNNILERWEKVKVEKEDK